MWKMHLLTLWRWPLTFQPQIHVTSSVSQSPKFEKSGLFVFGYAADKQTNRQTTDVLQNPPHIN